MDKTPDERTAKSVPGVVVVVDNLEVRPDGGDQEVRTPPPFLPGKGQ